jgi:bifunctional non-homologous end joining protein LigD
MMVVRNRVRLISRGGHDWARHFPLIVAAALKLRQQHFVIDGEVVVLDEDGVSDFDALAKHDKRAQFYAFDMLAGDGEDFRPQVAAQGQSRPTAQAPRGWHLHRGI